MRGIILLQIMRDMLQKTRDMLQIMSIMRGTPQRVRGTLQIVKDTPQITRDPLRMTKGILLQVITSVMRGTLQTMSIMRDTFSMSNNFCHRLCKLSGI